MKQQTLLLLPGLMCDSFVWHDQISHFNDDLQIVVPDLSQANTPKQMVAAALEAAPASFLLAGHSMGGWVALEIMKSAPERVSKLCLANTSAQLDSPAKAKARREMIEQAKNGDYDGIIQRLSTAFVYQQQRLPAVLEMLKRNQHAFIHQEQAMLDREDCVPILNQITCPTLVIHSAKDAVFNLTDSRQLADKIKNSDLAVIEESGHMSPMEQPEQFSNLMQKWVRS